MTENRYRVLWSSLLYWDALWRRTPDTSSRERAGRHATAIARRLELARWPHHASEPIRSPWLHGTARQCATFLRMLSPRS